MKKSSVLMCVLGLSVFLCACQKEMVVEPTKEITSESTIDEITSEAVEEEVLSEENIANQAETVSKDVVELTADEEGMLPVMDAMLMCMTENDYTFAPKDPEFFWSNLFYLIGCYHSLTTTGATEDYDASVIRVYYRVVQDFATGAYEDYSDLLEIPEGYTNVSINPEDTEQYLFTLGDRGLSQARILEWVDNGDDTYTVTVELYSIEEEEYHIATGEFTLVPNSYNDGSSQMLFAYSVRNAVVLDK